MTSPAQLCLANSLRILGLLVLALGCASWGWPALDEDLLGTWEAVDGSVVVLQGEGRGTLDGEPLEWKAWGKDRLRVRVGGETQRGRYVLSGERLVVTFDGVELRYRRRAKPQPEAPVERSPGEQGQDAQPAPGVRFEGQGLVLELRARPPAFEGFLDRGGRRFTARAVRHGDALYGALLVDGAIQEFRAVGDPQGQLQLHLGGEAFSLVGHALGQGPGMPPPLEGAAKVKGQRWEHPRGWFSFELPRGWTVVAEEPEGLWLNPGLGQQDNLDALVVLEFGELTPEQSRRAPSELLDELEPELRAAWRKESVRLERPESAAQAVLVGETPGAYQEWSGRAGERAVRFWLGGVTKRDAYLTVGALLLAGQEARFLPQVKRIFETLEARPPVRNPQLERLLEGRRVSHSSTNASGFFGTVYDFFPGNRVQRKILFSGGLGVSSHASGSSADAGSYEVVGDQLFLYFQDKQESGQVVLEGGQLAGVRFGQQLYASN